MCVWHPEADSLQFDSKALEIVYRNKRVNSYLDSLRKLGISGIKGQGKTFLIKAKRQELQQKGSVLLMPKDSVMIDSLDADIRVRSNQKKFLSSYTNWVALWKTAIIITIIQHPEIREQISETVFDKISQATRELLGVRNDDYRPSVIVYSIMQMNRNTINKSFMDLPQLLQAISYIHRPIALFIDKTDQAFAHDIYEILGDTNSTVGTRNASIWQYSQLALANAAYDIFSSSNQHIKVFYTIRQEALVDAENIAPNVFRNFSSYITALEYSKEDLYQMFVLYINNETDDNLRKPEMKEKNPEMAFVGYDIIKHGYVKDVTQSEERLFDYIYRHSMSRPSDIQQICWDLHISDIQSLDIDTLKHSVNASSRKILNQFIAEMNPFSSRSKISIETLLSGITTNVFDMPYMKSICKRYMLMRGVNESCKMNCNQCNAVYPFAYLYNIGLLGYLYSNQSSQGHYEQKFISATNRMIADSTVQIVPSELYFLHPCVSDMADIQRKNYRREYSNTNIVIVGNHCQCSNVSLKRIKMEIEKHKKALIDENVFISSTMESMHEKRMSAAKALMQKGFYPVYCENPNYIIDTRTFSHDNCIDEILNCGSFVTIFGDKYGGEYAGLKYRDYADEIVKKSNGRIEKPSITLMEYYVSRIKGKTFLAIMSNKVVEYRKSTEYRDRKTLPWKEKNDLDRMVIVFDFLNKLKLSAEETVPSGNMMKFYENADDIEICISDHYFK